MADTRLVDALHTNADLLREVEGLRVAYRAANDRADTAERERERALSVIGEAWVALLEGAFDGAWFYRCCQHHGIEVRRKPDPPTAREPTGGSV